MPADVELIRSGLWCVRAREPCRKHPPDDSLALVRERRDGEPYECLRCRACDCEHVRAVGRYLNGGVG